MASTESENDPPQDRRDGNGDELEDELSKNNKKRSTNALVV